MDKQQKKIGEVNKVEFNLELKEKENEFLREEMLRLRYIHSN